MFFLWEQACDIYLGRINKKKIIKTRKAIGFTSLRLKYWEANQATSKSQIDFWTRLDFWSKIEKVNINVKFCIFKLVYSRVPNRRGVGMTRKEGGGEWLENWKFNSRGGLEEILFDTLQ